MWPVPMGNDDAPRFLTRFAAGGDTRALAMRCAGLSLLLTMMSVSVVAAQRDTAAPAAIEPKLDTPQVRVIVATLQPRAPAIAANGHSTNRVLIYLDNG